MFDRLTRLFRPSPAEASFAAAAVRAESEMATLRDAVVEDPGDPLTVAVYKTFEGNTLFQHELQSKSSKKAHDAQMAVIRNLAG